MRCRLNRFAMIEKSVVYLKREEMDGKKQNKEEPMKHTLLITLAVIAGLLFVMPAAISAPDSNGDYLGSQETSQPAPEADAAQSPPQPSPEEPAPAGDDPVTAKDTPKGAEPIIQDYLDQVKVEDTLSSMASLRAVLTKTDEQISSVITAIDQLSEQNEIAELMGNPLTKQFKKFIREIEKTATYINAVIDAALTMQESGTAYFNAWEKSLEEFNNTSIRNRSRRRLSLMQRDFDQISRDVDRLKSKLEPFLAQLQDIRNFLNYDLNAEAIASISDLFTRTGTEAGRIHGQISSAIGKLDVLSTAMSPNK